MDRKRLHYHRESFSRHFRIPHLDALLSIQVSVCVSECREDSGKMKINRDGLQWTLNSATSKRSRAQQFTSDQASTRKHRPAGISAQPSTMSISDSVIDVRSRVSKMPAPPAALMQVVVVPNSQSNLESSIFYYSKDEKKAPSLRSYHLSQMPTTRRRFVKLRHVNCHKK